MTLYCYYFKLDGSVKRESVECKKYKDRYVFKVEPCDTICDVYFDEVGYIFATDSPKDDHQCCRMYLTEKIEITEEMKNFAKIRAKKLKELWDMRAKVLHELIMMEGDVYDNLPY